MGKFLPFHKPSSSSTDPLRPTGKKIVKRTSHFLQKKAAKFTQQAYHFQHPRPRPPPSSSTTQQQQQHQHQYLLTSSSQPSLVSLTDHDRCRQAYQTFLITHGLEKQAWPKSWKESISAQDASSMSFNAAQLHFQELLYEVVWTEHTYVDDLTLAYQIFAKDALTSSDLPKSLRLIFDNLVQIIRLHLGLLQDLRERQRAQHPIVRTIADIFLIYTPRFLDYYSAYFINFEKANQVVVRSMASKTDPLGVYFRTRSNWPECRNLTLQSFLLKPVQRLMKYPLFFKSLSDSLAHSDPDRLTHLRTLHELKLVIERIEMDKKESEEDRKLEDLASRIQGMPSNLVIPNRRLVYEGYLTLLPSMHAPLMRSVTKDALGTQHYTYAPHPNVVRSHSFSSSIPKNNKKKKRLYVFLFNDMILCTKVRSKSRVLDEEESRLNCYGPTPYALFKLTHGPGQLTFVDRSVARLVHNNNNNNNHVSTGTLGSSLRRSWSSTHHHHPSVVHPFQTQEYEEHPHQFICSIATRHITNYHFETATDDEKKQWCSSMDQVLESHVQRPDWWDSPAIMPPPSSSTSLYSKNHIAASFDQWPLLHEKTQIPLQDMEVDATSPSDRSNRSRSSSNSSNTSSETETMFTTAASSPIGSVLRLHAF